MKEKWRGKVGREGWRRRVKEEEEEDGGGG